VTDTIVTERQGEVLVITLNRPDRLNAWTPHMASELAEAIEQGNRSADVGAIVMTGAGRGFCAGADMEDTFAKRIAGQDPGEDTAGGQGGMPASLDWVSLCLDAKPLIAAVNGACVGIGITQILSFDVIIASEKAKFGIGFIKVGLVPELASTRFLTHRMGPGQARMFALSGDLWSADQALAAGLVDRVVSADALMDEAIGLAARIATNPAPQLQWTKSLLAANALEPDLAVVQGRESALLRDCWASVEHAEAVQAFQEKRAPVFPPRAAPAATSF
jgi:enoyl-CoA hydratase/carnithine racemase